MNAKELRIGNWIKFNDTPIANGCYKVLAIQESLIVAKNGGAAYPNEIKPIPLTEEWLIKFGFELCDNTKYNIWSNEHFVITDILMQGDSFLWFIKEDESLNLNYVHQLQNLYFALTCEELTIKTKQL
jgi:hypothetical protein